VLHMILHLKRLWYWLGTTPDELTVLAMKLHLMRKGNLLSPHRLGTTHGYVVMLVEILHLMRQ
jgi:hypothetical protein